MSWLISRALMEDYANSLSSPEQVGEFLAENCSDGEPSAQLNVMPTLHRFWHNDKTMDASTLSRFGLTCRILTEKRGEALLTWFRADFRVRTSAQPERAPESTGNTVAYGSTWREWFARYDPNGSSWKTRQCSLLGDSEQFLETWPTSGLMRRGQCFPLPTLAPITYAKESGFWATPTASDGMRGGTITDKMTGQSLAQMVNTPAKWPTPTVCGNYNRKGMSATSGDGLATAVNRRIYPTPTATAYKGWSPNHNRADTDDRLDYTIERDGFSPGQQTPPMRLNPDWVEWLMGWPIGQTELKPLGMDKFQEWRQQHSPSWLNK